MYRWIISPVSQIVIPDTEGGDPDVYRAPRVCQYIDPSLGKRYQHSSIIHDGDWCFSVVMSDDWTPLDADALCISLFETQFNDQLHLDQTPRDLGFTVPHLTRIKTKLEARGVDTSLFTRDTPLADLLQALAVKLHPRFGGIRRTWLRPPPATLIPFVADATIFSDTFTEASANPTLNNHTPSPTGTSWVRIIQVTQDIYVMAATDDASAPLGSGALGALYKSQPDPSVNTYDVSLKLITPLTADVDQPWRIHARMADKDNYYAAKFWPTGNTTHNDTELIKNVANTVTVLANVDTGLTANDVFLLEMRDAAKRVLKNGAEILTNSDDALTAAGSAGMSVGTFDAASTDTGNKGNWHWDDYLVDEVAAAGGTILPQMIQQGLYTGGAR